MTKLGFIRYGGQTGISIYLGRILELVWPSVLSEEQKHSDSGCRVLNDPRGIFDPEVRLRRKTIRMPAPKPSLEITQRLHLLHGHVAFHRPTVYRLTVNDEDGTIK